jgi:arylsulfatase A-like enzyme
MAAMTRLGTTTALWLPAILTACTPDHAESGAADLPQVKNLLMISVDTYRRDFMARYGGSYGVTDFMDSLAAESLVLDDHSSCSNWTLPSVLCATDGRDSADFGYVAHISGEDREVVPSRPSLASWLKDQGFATVLYTANGWLEGEWHHDEGYAEAVDLGTASAPIIWSKGRSAMLRQRENTGADRWFLHLHFDEPHAPYNPPEEYLTELQWLDPISWDLENYAEHQEVRFLLESMSEEERELVLEHLRIRYIGEMAYFDDLLEEVVQDMEDSGYLDDTLLVLWTDHGEAFYERSAWGHSYYLYQEETGSVALFNHPEIGPQAWTEPTTHIDIAPTILSYLGVEQPAEVTGQIVGTAPADRVQLKLTSGQVGPQLRATSGSLRMDLDYRSGLRRLYDVTSDPGEQEDICDLGVGRHAGLWNALEAYADRLEPLLPMYARYAEPRGCR